MAHRRWLAMSLCLFLAGGPALVARGDAAQPDSIASLELQVAALTTIDELELTGDQIAALQNMAADTADDSLDVSPTSGNTSMAYRRAIFALRDALASGDEQRIAQTQSDMDKLRRRQNILPQATVTETDQAKKKAYAAVSILTAGQYANYIAIHATEVPDAAETILDALDRCQTGADDDYQAMREEAAQQVAMLMNGPNDRMSKRTIANVSRLLDQARNMSSADFQANRDELYQSARNLTRLAKPDLEVRNWMERQMADLLSNPQLSRALSARSR